MSPRPVLAPLIVALMAGCTQNLAGDWYGICEFSDATYGYSGAVSITVLDGGGQRISGTVNLEMPDDRTFQGDMTGIHSDVFVEMEAPLSGEGGNYIFVLEGDLEDDGSIDGTCQLKPGEGGAGLIGDIVLEQP